MGLWGGELSFRSEPSRNVVLETAGQESDEPEGKVDEGV